MQSQRLHYIIKTLNFNRKQFNFLKKKTRRRYSELKKNSISYTNFEAWSLFATVFGIFTSYGDKEASLLFCKYLMQNILPKIYMFECKNIVRICICIIENKIDEYYPRSKNIATSS